MNWRKKNNNGASMTLFQKAVASVRRMPAMPQASTGCEYQDRNNFGFEAARVVVNDKKETSRVLP